MTDARSEPPPRPGGTPTAEQPTSGRLEHLPLDALDHLIWHPGSMRVL